MKQYLSIFLPVLAVVSLAAAQTAVPPDSAKSSAPAAALAKPDTAKAKASAPAKNDKQAASGTSGKTAGQDSAKVKTPASPAAKTPPAGLAGKAATALAKPDSVKAKANPAAQNRQAPPVLTPAPMAVQPDTAQAPLPPLPPMRNAITTEKTVADKPEGVTPRPKTAESTAAPALAKAAAPDASGSSPAGQAPAAGAPPALTPVVSKTAGGADSSAVAVLPPQSKDRQAAPAPGTPAKPRTSDTFHEELTIFNSPTGGMRTMKVIIDDQYNLVGMVYGEELGFVRILTADNNGNFTETWKSPPLNSQVMGVFVDNLDNTGEAEIVAYTAEGNIFIFGYDTHEQKYKTPDGTYQGILCMLVANVDADPAKELLFITKAGKMVQFDPATKFEEWTSTETYTSTDMVLGNVDNDRETELVLNTGEVMNLRYKSVEWKMEGKLVSPNSRLFLMDVDSDGILELIIRYDQNTTRIIDVDQRREKW